MNKQVFTARAREMGEELRRRRAEARLNGEELRRKLGWPTGKLSYIESGSRPPSELDVASYLSACGPIQRPDYERLVALAAEPNDGYWLRPNGAGLSEELRSLIVQESLASTITAYEPLVVPGLLQCESYARSLLNWNSPVKPQTVELRVQARLARQGLLHRAQPPHCTFYLQEQALQTVVSDAGVMNEQVLYLMLTGAQPHCVLRVVPDAAGPFAAWSGGGIRVMDYEKHTPLAYSEGLGFGVFLERPEDVLIYRGLLSRLNKVALSEGESRAWLAELASAYDRAEAIPSCPSPSKPG
ncbi:DUF5753 domain-containing protein [Amycolatopsis sp. H20-H5]|uniref:DUF5753 domain-containing protein n=1 Tax=Amycolatopsis sp. H20-H5 TaxID=3046309 RepID=UPI002DBA909E|nr:DUF5753 domain-containing protein [Amycolatopsis sp. H20-H5]MEC3975309.1 DUF5753 domain-containing protein [Amycolatopsis sp. H20-H5]